MKKTSWLVPLLALFLFVGPAWAEEKSAVDTDRAAETEHGSPIDVVFRWLNFAVLFGGLGYLLRKPMADFFKARAEGIQGGLLRAQTAQDESERNLAAIEDRLVRLDGEITQIQTAGKASADSERGRIVTSGKLEVDRAIARARVEIDRAGRAFEREIREHVADLIIEGASNRLQARITEDEQKGLVTSVVEDIKL